MNQVIARLNELLGKDVRPVHTDLRAGDVRHSVADISQAKQLLGYEPQVGLDQGLERAIEYYKSLAAQQ